MTSNQKKSFFYHGTGPLSKSLLNRAYIIKSFYPNFKIPNPKQKFYLDKNKKQALVHEESKDSLYAKKAIETLSKGACQFDCGDSASLLRFLSVRLSRIPNKIFKIRGSKSLFKRPLAELFVLLNQLEVPYTLDFQEIEIQGQNWKIPKKPIYLKDQKSSQLVSALFLNAWELNKNLKICIEKSLVSYSYLEMTLNFVSDLGLQYIKKETSDALEFTIPKKQKLKKKHCQIEADMSCLFAIASFAILGGEAHFENFPQKSLQPDFYFVDILKQIGCKMKQENNILSVFKSSNLKTLSCNLINCPDLFPLLSTLLSFLNQESKLYGAPHLIYKESDRLNCMAQLLQSLDVRITKNTGGLTIKGPLQIQQKSEMTFDPLNDHRMFMAASLAKAQGAPIKILNPQSVNKSFPDFLKIINPKTLAETKA